MSLGGDASLRSSVAIGNGRGYQEDDLQLKFDTNGPKQGYAQVEVKGVGARDLRFGISGVYGYISPDARRIDPEGLFEYIGGAHVAYPSAPLTVVAEGYSISHKGHDRSWETYDGFLLVGYTFAPVTPYLQVERLVMTHGVDPFYVVDPAQLRPPALSEMTGLDVAELIAGMRWDTSTWSAVKVEYRLSRFLDQDLTTHVGYAAWQFGL
jgi:hypothetical protein